MKTAKCHPDRPEVARGLCDRCYRLGRYHNAPGVKEARVDSVTRYQRRVGRFRLKPEPQDIPGIKEGFTAYKCDFTAAEDKSLTACLRRRGLLKVRTWRGWAEAA